MRELVILALQSAFEQEESFNHYEEFLDFPPPLFMEDIKDLTDQQLIDLMMVIGTFTG
jgi:hypothetical protein